MLTHGSPTGQKIFFFTVANIQLQHRHGERSMVAQLICQSIYLNDCQRVNGSVDGLCDESTIVYILKCACLCMSAVNF